MKIDLCYQKNQSRIGRRASLKLALNALNAAGCITGHTRLLYDIWQWVELNLPAIVYQQEERAVADPMRAQETKTHCLIFFFGARHGEGNKPSVWLFWLSCI